MCVWQSHAPIGMAKLTDVAGREGSANTDPTRERALTATAPNTTSRLVVMVLLLKFEPSPALRNHPILAPTTECTGASCPEPSPLTNALPRPPPPAVLAGAGSGHDESRLSSPTAFGRVRSFVTLSDSCHPSIAMVASGGLQVTRRTRTTGHFRSIAYQGNRVPNDAFQRTAVIAR